jgi:pyruvate/2-oxoglutarate dehydrogenase complex dihydrolipoamide dehydrogenase (E3) component
MEAKEYDLVVIGSGPAGQKGAICAAKLRKKVAIVDRKRTIGGVCVHTGTIPSKTLRQAVLYLTGFSAAYFLRPKLCFERSDLDVGPDFSSASGNVARD